MQPTLQMPFTRTSVKLMQLSLLSSFYLFYELNTGVHIRKYCMILLDARVGKPTAPERLQSRKRQRQKMKCKYERHDGMREEEIEC